MRFVVNRIQYKERKGTMFLTAVLERVRGLNPRQKAFLVVGVIFLLAAIGPVVLGVKMWERASNPPLGWVTTTTPDVWLPSNVHLKPSFTNVHSERMGFGGGTGVGAPQIGEFWDEYPQLAEAEGSYNILDVSDEVSGAFLTYITYADGEERGWHAVQRGLEEKPQADWGKYHLIERGENRSRIEDGRLVLRWRYQRNTAAIVFLLLIRLLAVGYVLYLAFEPLKKLFLRRTLRR